ncbi:MAG: endonuclease V [Candidatus Omnitrophota bacterium]|nr:MAG: endonuclease V [Candidatus Omnitrophota bacterium]
MQYKKCKMLPEYQNGKIAKSISTPLALKALDSLQENLKKYIVYTNRCKRISTLAGCDVHYEGDCAQAGICVFDYNLQLLERVSIRGKVAFPYIPGYLAFREAPILIEAISRLKIKPDCFLFDGNGVLHPRMMGLATFLGIVLEMPTIGCTKNLLLGNYPSLGEERGHFSLIRYRKRIVGAALRTKSNTREIYVSVGWGITLKTALSVVLDTSCYRIPEPLRLAHMQSKTGRFGETNIIASQCDIW